MSQPDQRHYLSHCTRSAHSTPPRGTHAALESFDGFEVSELSDDNSQLVNVITRELYICLCSYGVLTGLLAGIRGGDLTVGLEQIPAECYMLIQSGDTRWRTSIKPLVQGEATEWEDQIPL